MLTNLGLALIGIGWLYQMVRVIRSGTALYAIFLMCYVFGSALIVVDGLITGPTLVTYFNLAFGLAALTTLVSLNRHP